MCLAELGGAVSNIAYHALGSTGVHAIKRGERRKGEHCK